MLALLSEQPTHGFALARTMAPDGEVGQVWALRRPLVYRALETLDRVGFARPAGTQPSSSGPQRTMLEITDTGQSALAQWLIEPVARVRDARSLLMLKLLFLIRRDADLEPLLVAQRERFLSRTQALASAAEQAVGFERALLVWRLQSTEAAVRFTETMLAEREPSD